MLRNAGRCREAADLVTKAGRRHPGDPWLHYQLYGSFHELELPGQAFRYALAAAALRPGSAEIRNSLGALLLEAGDHEGAWTCCRAALRIAPGHEHAPGNSIIDLEALGDHAGATTLAEEVLRRAAEGSVAPGSRGRALEHLGRLDEATEAYRQAIEGDPENLWAYERLGSVLEAAGRFEEAVECYRCARARLSTLVESPQHAKWLAWLHGRLGLVLCDKLGRIDEAIDHFRQAIALAPDKAEHLSNLGVALRKTGHLEEAIAAWEQALRVDPGYLHTYGVLGFALTQLDRLDEAEAALRTAAERGEGPGSLAQLGTFLEIRMRGRPGENIELLTEAVRREPGNPDYLNNLATALLSAMRGAEALEVLERLPEGEKEQTARSFNLGRALAILGRWQEAEPFLRRGAEGLPTPWPWELLGRTLSTLGRHPEAVEAFRKSIALGPERAKSHGLLGRALLQTGAMKEAADALRKALELDPRDAETAAQLGFLLSQRLGRHGEAVAPLFRAVALEPGRGAWWTFLALALSNVGRLDAAIASARKGAALQASWPEAHRILGLLLHRAGRYAEAIEILSEGVDLHPRDALIRLGLAQALCNQGEYREALARLGEVEELGAPPGVDLARLFEWFRWLAEATERMPEYLAGHWKPESTTGLLALGSVLQSPQHADRPVAAARLYRELFTKESAAARGSTPAGANLANPVCAAVCAGTGEGKDAAGLPEAERAAWRRTALGWLRDLL
ncbi:MAG: tetratricopeptide repeat protein, partial [Planctomycetes bacterium]|nr:tetratricopeptide repeat protein [Planctomycetota bacterium]